jgi:hypothetical protein
MILYTYMSVCICIYIYKSVSLWERGGKGETESEHLIITVGLCEETKKRKRESEKMNNTEIDYICIWRL